MQDVKDLSLAQLVELGARDAIVGDGDLLGNPLLTTEEGQRAFVEALLTEPGLIARRSMFGGRARDVMMTHVLRRKDPVILALLRRILDDASHPLQQAAFSYLLASKDREIIEPIYDRAVAALDVEKVGTYRHRLCEVAVFLMGAEAVVRELVPRYLTPAAAAANSEATRHVSSILHELGIWITNGRVARDHLELARAVVALGEVTALGKPVKQLLALLDRVTVAAAKGGSSGAEVEGSAKPVAKKKSRTSPSAGKSAAAPATYLERYLAGEHEAVWTELRALGDAVREPKLEADARAVAAATMKAFGENVAKIARSLREAKYDLVVEEAVVPAKAGASEKIAALEKIVGPLPLAIEAFYRTFEVVSLAQDVDAVIDDSPVFSDGLLDELGRRDPLVLASLRDVLKDAERQKAAATSPILLYVAPDPDTKGTIDDEMPDELPVRTASSRGIDAVLSGSADGHLVDWLRAYVQNGGFLGAMEDEDRAHLLRGLQPF